FKAHVVSAQVDAFEILLGKVLRYVRGLRNGRIHPLLGSRLNVYVLLRSYTISGGEAVWPLLAFFCRERRAAAVYQVAVSQQFEGEYVYLFFGFATFTDDVPRIVVRETGLNTVTGVVGQRQADGAGGCNGGMVSESATFLSQLFDQFWLDMSNLL